MDPTAEKKCALCGAALEGVGARESGEHRCGRCGATGRYAGESLVAIFIPNYYARLAELESLNRELVQEINLEGARGEQRDMRFLQKKHLERQGALAEYVLISYFRPFVEKW
ncbi:MAG: RNHCP domain-containing protein [Actinobacteria bacterium]|nr:RNHCP domain-containing protein [Actinomycetota bacterium]